MWAVLVMNMVFLNSWYIWELIESFNSLHVFFPNLFLPKFSGMPNPCFSCCSLSQCAMAKTCTFTCFWKMPPGSQPCSGNIHHQAKYRQVHVLASHEKSGSSKWTYSSLRIRSILLTLTLATFTITSWPLPA